MAEGRERRKGPVRRAGWLMLTVFLGLSAPAAAAEKGEKKRPNILVILADDCGSACKKDPVSGVIGV